MENLSDDAEASRVDGAPPAGDGAAGAGWSQGAASVTLARPAVSLEDLPADPPPPGLWPKLEAQLRREGLITD